MPKILLVEDNELSRDMLARRLSRRGYQVISAADGPHGIAMARDQSPDLIVMDMSLPELDGWEATRRLKRDPATRAIPVIALTAHAMSSDRKKAMDAGCDDYHTKPVDFERLVRSLEGFLEVRGRRPRTANVVPGGVPISLSLGSDPQLSDPQC
jgi:CheY-like chemotaxis protein